MRFSCDTCPVKGVRCDGCMMGVFETIPVRSPELDGEDMRVLDILCRSGLVTDEDAARAKLEYAPHRVARAAV